MKNIKYTLMALLYANTILFLCSCIVYASGYHQLKENMKIKKAAAEVLNFPELSN